MKFSDVSKKELESGNYSDETIQRLMENKRIEFSVYLRASASKYIPMIIGSYLAICACLAGYALAYGESVFVFSKIYHGLIYLWLPFCVMLPISWYRARPTEKDLTQELGWYNEILESSGTIEA